MVERGFDSICEHFDACFSSLISEENIGTIFNHLGNFNFKNFNFNKSKFFYNKIERYDNEKETFELVELFH